MQFPVLYHTADKDDGRDILRALHLGRHGQGGMADLLQHGRLAGSAVHNAVSDEEIRHETCIYSRNNHSRCRNSRLRPDIFCAGAECLPYRGRHRQRALPRDDTGDICGPHNGYRRKVREAAGGYRLCRHLRIPQARSGNRKRDLRILPFACRLQRGTRCSGHSTAACSQHSDIGDVSLASAGAVHNHIRTVHILL